MLTFYIKIAVTVVIVIILVVIYLHHHREVKNGIVITGKEWLKEKEKEGKVYYQCRNCQKLFENPAYIKTFTSNPVKVKVVCPYCFEVLGEKKNA